METYDTDITIYNHLYNTISKTDEWRRTHIKDVSWYGGQKVAVSDSGLNSANTYTVRIPLEKSGGFLLPEEYAGKPGTWTLNAGDIVVKGLIVTDIVKASELSDISCRFVVIGWRDNRRGIPMLQHIRIEGA